MIDRSSYHSSSHLSLPTAIWTSRHKTTFYHLDYIYTSLVCQLSLYDVEAQHAINVNLFT